MTSATISRADTAASLPFVRRSRKTDTLTLWSPTRSGDYAQDCACGRTYGEALLEHMGVSGHLPLLGQVVKAIAEAGEWGGVEIGFTQAIAEAAAR